MNISRYVYVVGAYTVRRTVVVYYCEGVGYK